MKYKLSPIERSVGFFILFSFVGMSFICASILARNLFWQDKVTFNIKLNTAGQLQEGSKVQLKGMNIGKVTKVILNDDAEVVARFEVSRDFYKFFTTSSQIQIVNPMVIGDKIVELKYIPSPILVPSGSFLPVVESEDIINKLTAINWKEISPILTNLKLTLIKTDMIAGKVDSQLPKMFTKTDKLASDASIAIQGANKLTTEAMQAIHGTNKLIADLQETTPLLKAAAKDLPAASDKGVKAIGEAIIVLRAMQKSFFLKSNAEEVKEEIAAENAKKDNDRVPASAK
jgi:phospholipid/cholesterol/gamma-HCH transport system substrate-binding protein